MTDPAKHGEIRTYGRRRGRPLRPQRAGLMRELLPRIAVPETALDAPPGSFDPTGLFATPVREVWLELGFGAGEHLAEQAARHRDVGILGCEVFENGVAALLRHIDAGGLANVRIHPDDARPLLDVLAAASVARLFVLFPDPWPKKRHARRRLLSPETLDTFARILADRGVLRVATDDPIYAAAIAAMAADAPAFRRVGGGLAEAGWRPADAPVSRYEAKALSAGRVPMFLELARVPRDELARDGLARNELERRPRDRA